MSTTARKRLPAAKGKAHGGDVAAPEFSDDALASELADKQLDYLRFHPEARCWMFWNGQYWQKDVGGFVVNAIRHICRQAAARIDEPTKALRIASNQKISAVEVLARTDPRLAAASVKWDTDDWLLNTPENIVDLRTGESFAHDPALLISRMTPMAPGGDCTRWHLFLNRITGGNHELQLFLQRMAGYCLTGSVKEQVLFYLLGPGANGKSIFMRVLSAMLGPYATTAAMDAFLELKLTRHPADLAALRSARLVLASESDRNARWAEAKVKVLTGGDAISARLMRQDYSTYSPHFKIILAGNDPPSLSGTGEAIRRRFQFIPFGVTIPAPERDLDLYDKLCAELPGIFKWAIDGCLAWQSQGLAPPRCITDFTANYFDSQDVIGRFIAECCEPEPSYRIGSTELYERYRSWAKRQGEHVPTQRSFVLDISAHGFLQERSAKKRFIRGLRLAGSNNSVADGSQ